MGRNWRESLADFAARSADDIEELADVAWRRLASRLGLNEPRHIAAYHGYANDERLWIRGRLLADAPYGGPQDDDNWWDNLRATYARWESDEIPDAEIALTYAGERISVTTDAEGYYTASFPLAADRPRAGAVLAEHVDEDRVLTALHRVTVLDPSARYMVVSDMDDTVIETGVTQLLLAARLTFLYNAKTRKPLPGVAELYRAFRAGAGGDVVNPILYVSNSAWNLFDLLRDFMDLNDIPPGPLLLRDIGIKDIFATETGHKRETVRELMDRYPALPAILVGDTGQHDAEIYAEVAAEYPERVLAIYVRDVDPDEDSELDRRVDAVIERPRDLGIPFLRVSNSAQIAEHAVASGLLPASVMASIARGTKVDEQRETLEEAATAEEGD